MKYTDKLGLPIWNKPETDVFDIEQFNEGMQAIDDIIIKMVNQINGLVIGDTKVDLNEYVKEEVLKRVIKEEVETISSQLDTKANKIFITPEEFGAVGDGVNDDTLSFQKAIDYAKNNNLRVECVRNKVYLIKKQGSKIVKFGTTSNTYDYSLIVYNNTYINLNGSTIKNTESDYPSIFINESMFNNTENISNNNITITNGNFVMNALNTQPKKGNINNCIHFFFVNGCNLTNLNFKNILDGAIGGHCNANFYIDNINIDTVKGNGIALGICSDSTGCESRLIDSYIGSLNISNVYENISPKVANPFICCMKNVDIKYIKASNCCMGIKIQDNSENVTINTIFFDGGDVSTANSGLKIQGLNELTKATNIKVNNVYSRNCNSTGLYIQNADSITINNYKGENNNISNSGCDIWVHKTNILINNAYVKNSNGGVQVRAGADNITFDNVIIEDCNGIAFSDSANRTNINMLKVINQDDSYTTAKSYSNYISDSRSKINSIIVDAKTKLYPTVYSDKVTCNEIIQNISEDTELIVTLSDSTYTDIVNSNFIYLANGNKGYMTSLLDITNINSNVVITRYSNITNGFRLWHDKATGTEKVLVKIKGMKVFPNSL